MKIYTAITGFSVCALFANFAQAKIVHGTIQDYFSNLYATVPVSHTRLPEFDNRCKSKHWYLVNTPFSVDYRVNTDSGLMAAFFSYANVETLLNGAESWEPDAFDMLSTDLHKALKDIHVKLMVFNVSKTFTHTSAHIVFENDDPQMVDKYQCVLST